MFDLEIYHQNLNTEYIGKNIQYFEDLDSTNTKAFKLVSKNANNGTVVITDNQTAGRGRQSNKWFSLPNKSLTFSIILYPDCSIVDINKYSIITGLAVSDGLIEFNIKPKLKWPNDILINHRKVGGILCESKLSGEIIKSLVIGIGLNINENIGDLPDNLQSKSTTLLSENGQLNKIEIVLANILNIFEQRLNNINHFENQITDWEKNCAHLNSEVSFKYDNNIINGIFNGLTTKGQAILSFDEKEKIFNSGIII